MRRGAKAILHYLRGTLSAGLLYKRDPSFNSFRVTAMSDSTWADDPYDSCSPSGFIVKLNHQGRVEIDCASPVSSRRWPGRGECR